MTYFTIPARQVFAATTVAVLRTGGPASQFVDGMVAKVAGGSLYEWNSTSAASDNGTTVIKPTAVGGAGRWLLIAGGGGTQGFQGAQGQTGFQGAQGAQGVQGSQGSVGSQGFQGANELPIVPGTILTFNTSIGTADVTAYTVPAAPAGINRFTDTFVIIRLETAIVGAGTVVVRAGTTTGGNDLLVDSVAWTSATPVGTAVGFSIADLGTAFLAANGYNVQLAASATVKARATTAGAVITGGSAKVSVYGYVTP